MGKKLIKKQVERALKLSIIYGDMCVLEAWRNYINDNFIVWITGKSDVFIMTSDELFSYCSNYYKEMSDPSSLYHYSIGYKERKRGN